MRSKGSDECSICWGQNADSDAAVSWIRCDICRQWLHTNCLDLSAREVSEISSFHCYKCEAKHGPSHKKRHLKRSRVRIDYVALDQGETFAVDKSVHPHVSSFLAFEPLVARGLKLQEHVQILDSESLTADYISRHGLPKPILIPDVDETCGMVLPAPRSEISVDYITAKTGRKQPVEVMDVLLQQSELPGWNMGQWRDYFYTDPQDRDRIRNVILLEVSDVDGLSGFRRPAMVRDMDLVDAVWRNPDLSVAPNRPKVTVYCLMLVAGLYTDFHIDFSGTPVYYTVCQGTKTFLMYPPTDDNLALYESWCQEPEQNFTWFGAYTKRIKGRKLSLHGGFKVDLKAGDLFIIPSGWIHSVYTPEDAVILGGNYLTLRDVPMHLQIYEIERRTKVPQKYRFPMFNKVMWLTAWYYSLKDASKELSPANTKIEREESTPVKEEDTHLSLEAPGSPGSTLKTATSFPVQKPPDAARDLKAAAPAPDGPAESMAADPAHRAWNHIRLALVKHLQHHYEVSQNNQVAKNSIPKAIGRNPQLFIESLARSTA